MLLCQRPCRHTMLCFPCTNHPHRRAALRLKRGTHFAYASAGSTASVARQVSQEYQAASLLSRAMLPFDLHFSTPFFLGTWCFVVECWQ